MKFIPSLALALLASPAMAGTCPSNLCGEYLVQQHYPGAVDTPYCRTSPGGNVVDPAHLMVNPVTGRQALPCKTIQYTVSQAASNPGGIGPGGAGDWRIIISPSPGYSSSNPDIYYENVVISVGGIAGHPFYYIGQGGGVQLRPPAGSNKPPMTIDADYVNWGKHPIQNSNVEGMHVGSTITTHHDIFVYYNSTFIANQGPGILVDNTDHFTFNNSSIRNSAGACFVIQNSTNWHIDTNSIYRCGAIQGAGGSAHGVEAYNSPGGFVGTEGGPRPSGTSDDLFLSGSPNTTVENNTLPYSCIVTPASDLASDTVIGNTCATQ